MLSATDQFNTIIEIGNWFIRVVQTETIRCYLGERKR